MNNSFVIIAEKFWVYLKQIYLELWNEMYTEENFWENICVPFLEDTPSGNFSQFSGETLRGNHAYELM
ncbi:MAG: hypothetical protein ACTSYI_14580 [Promethearchaeota archaeon]